MRLSIDAGSRAVSSPGWICQSCLLQRAPRGKRAFSGFNGRASGGESAKTLYYRTWTYSSTQVRPFSRSTSLRNATHSQRRDGKLPEGPARTRFAPSPTGYMHMGGLRTALFSYLLAKRTGGQFLLRIEDTDQKRFVSGAEERLCEDLQWAGIQWDEGPLVGGPYGPYKQSERTEIYQQHAEKLVAGNLAYRCFCTPQTAGAGIASYVTSGCYQGCASVPSGEADERATQQPFTVRLKQSPDVYKRKYPDLIYGNIKRLKRTSATSPTDAEDAGLDAADTVLLKSDGTPTYHFANVVDDHLMRITHVIRGTEWMASTPLHYDLYHAFGWTPPAFAHVGLLLDENKAKLSKRNADVALDVRGLREDHGVLPETLVNFLALLGWSNPNKSDVMNMAELIESFDLKFTTGNTMVRTEKLWFLQKHHVQRRCEKARMSGDLVPVEELVDSISQEAKARYPELSERFDTDAKLRDYCTNVLFADDKSYHNAQHFVARNWYFFTFDASRVPVAPEYYDNQESISSSAIDELATTLLVDIANKQPYLEPLFPSPAKAIAQLKADLDRPPTAIENESRRIHACINQRIWHAVLANSRMPHRVQVPFTNQPLDLEAYAVAFVDGVGTEAEDLLKMYKTWQKALMRHLRDRVSCGESGPGLGILMAVLGHDECHKRLIGGGPLRAGLHETA